jgi:hypothetical protein
MAGRGSQRRPRAKATKAIREKSPETLTVRISRPAHTTLRALAQERDESLTAMLDQAIELYRRHRFLTGLNADIAALRADATAWAEELAEREAWDRTLADGLED